MHEYGVTHFIWFNCLINLKGWRTLPVMDCELKKTITHVPSRSGLKVDRLQVLLDLRSFDAACYVVILLDNVISVWNKAFPLGLQRRPVTGAVNKQLFAHPNRLHSFIRKCTCVIWIRLIREYCCVTHGCLRDANTLVNTCRVNAPPISVIPFILSEITDSCHSVRGKGWSDSSTVCVSVCLCVFVCLSQDLIT